MHYRQNIVLVVLCLPVPLLVGCGRGNSLDRQAVSGQVTLDSKPLDRGSIQFCPELAQGGIFAGTLIVDGKYDVPGDKGLPPGKYKVRISAAQPDTPPTSPKSQSGFATSSPPPLRERLPAHYNANTTLTVEVKAGGGNVFDFALTSQPGA